MTEQSRRETAPPAPLSRPLLQPRPMRLGALLPLAAPLAAMALAIALAWTLAAGPEARAAAADPGLARVLRAMALFKAAAAPGALALLAWRLRRVRPMPAIPLAGWSIALGLLAAGPVLIWQVGPVAAGALVFHAGLILLLVTAFRLDRAALSAALAASLAIRRARRPGPAAKT